MNLKSKRMGKLTRIIILVRNIYSLHTKITISNSNNYCKNSRKYSYTKNIIFLVYENDFFGFLECSFADDKRYG